MSRKISDFFTKITILPFFRKLEFSWVLQPPSETTGGKIKKNKCGRIRCSHFSKRQDKREEKEEDKNDKTKEKKKRQIRTIGGQLYGPDKKEEKVFKKNSWIPRPK